MALFTLGGDSPLRQVGGTRGTTRRRSLYQAKKWGNGGQETGSQKDGPLGGYDTFLPHF